MSGPSSPLKAHSASPAELRERIEAERRGRPFLVYRGDGQAQRILDLDGHGTRISVGRGLTNELSLPSDTEVSRLHAELECIAGEWTVSDDGLSRNGTFVNSARISGRTRLRDGDVLRVGQTVIAYRRPEAEDSMPTQVAGNRMVLADLPPTQRQVLIALDQRGYVLTGSDVRDAGRWEADRDPYLLETSVPGVFACGDVRAGPVKRVAAAVGEGSMAIAFVHQFLREV